MRLMVRLILRLIGVVLLCLAITAGWVMNDAHRAIGFETEASSERVAHGLANLFWREILWRQSLRGDRLLLPAPEWETLETIKRVAFEEGVEAPMLARKFRDVAFPETDRERREKVRSNIAQTARKLSTLIAEEDSPVPKKLAIRVEELVGELLEAIEN